VTPGTPAPVLELREVCRHFGGVRAVDGFDLVVEPQRIVAVIGPNGAGKSTMFNLITGQLQLTSGEILFEGRRLGLLSPHRRTRLGMGRSFQLNSVFPSLSLYENVQVPLLASLRGPKRYLAPSAPRFRDRVMSVLEEVGLAEYAERPAGELSHGDKKRLEIAIVLALEPRLLLLDEPTAGMASEDRAAVMDLLVGIVRRRQLTMVFTEHDMDSVFAHAERLVVMERGRKLAEGPPAEVRKDERVREVYLGRGYRDSVTA
jgi:ABC-type branched-subunit amino acid transport system ATPase component